VVADAYCLSSFRDGAAQKFNRGFFFHEPQFNRSSIDMNTGSKIFC
jgi:hypothetical protein